MSPTVFRDGGDRFFFFSREEARVHIHVVSAVGEAKFWLDPVVALASHTGYSAKDLRRLQGLIQEHDDEIRAAWRSHFG